MKREGGVSEAEEEVRGEVRAGTSMKDRERVKAVSEIVDGSGEIVEAIDRGQAVGDSGEDLLIAALDGSIDAIPIGTEAAPQPTAHRAATRSVRLSVDLLDRMMSGMSAMVLADRKSVV